MGLRENLEQEPISSLDLRELIKVKPADTVAHAVELMRAKRLGCVVVVDDHGRPVGKFTEKRLLALLLKKPAALQDHVSDYMTTPQVALAQTEPIAKVLHAMGAMSRRFVIVLDEDGKAIALTGQKGVMEYIAEHFPRVVKVQMMESKLYMDQREGA